MVLYSEILEKVLVLLQFLEEAKAGESYFSFLLKGRLRLVSKGLKFLSLFPPPPLWLLYMKGAWNLKCNYERVHLKMVCNSSEKL